MKNDNTFQVYNNLTGVISKQSHKPESHRIETPNNHFDEAQNKMENQQNTCH